ncbi:phage terminase large subunit family protein [uncultured Paludibaculum sp.]|uniref:phage terminase large subunit family protein n=1 Tax=uncultured Paludibaculum sp. TaxID=1765020 RepID=UPI002AABC2E9|nr:phage terminase large subunit family protein [uncultured Paludibaculum sp.]
MMNSLNPLSTALQGAALAVLPPERVRLSEWADRHRRLSSEGSAAPGQWTTLPFQREPLDAISPSSPYQQIVLMWSSQVGKSEALLNLIAYAVAEEPGPILVVQPTLPMCEAFSKDRIAPLFRDTPALKGRVSDPKSRDSGSTIFHRRFIGGHLTIVGSNSPAGLASRPIRYLLTDEVDRWEDSAGAEGDQMTLATARTRTFWNRKVVMVSSPTVKGASRIDAAFLESDQRFYHVPCPFCNHRQRLIWPRVEWPDGEPGKAAYRCAGCEELIPNHRKAWMVARGNWIAQNPGSRIAGFHLSELYSPWRAWGDLAEDWLKAQGNPERLRAFINTSLAELWDDAGQVGVTEADLLARRENYGPALPDRAAMLTAGVDIQANRAEVSIYAWGAGEESWLMTHRVIPGDPTGPALWAALDNYLLQQWQHPLIGPMPIHAACVDSGFLAGQVTRFCDERRGRRVWAVKGMAGAGPVWPRKASKAPKGNVFVIHHDSLKTTLQRRLSITEGPGRIHFPATVGLPYFEQLNSEFLRTEYRRGRPERIWERRKGRAAEAWDAAVYAYAALFGLQAQGIHVDVEAARLHGLRQAGAAPAPGYQVYRSRFVQSA